MEDKLFPATRTVPRNPSLASQLLLRWRISKKLRTSQVAALIDVDQSYYCKFESGHNKPGRSMSVRIETLTEGMIKCGDWDREPLPLEPGTKNPFFSQVAKAS